MTTEKHQNRYMLQYNSRHMVYHKLYREALSVYVYMCTTGHFQCVRFLLLTVYVIYYNYLYPVAKDWPEDVSLK